MYHCPSCGREEGQRHSTGCDLINMLDHTLVGMQVVNLMGMERYSHSPPIGVNFHRLKGPIREGQPVYFNPRDFTVRGTMTGSTLNQHTHPDVPKQKEDCPAREKGPHNYEHQGREIIDDRRVDVYYCKHCLQYRYVALDPVKDGPPTIIRYPLYTEPLQT